MVKRNRSPNRAPTAEEARELARAIQSLGDFAHVTVRAERGYLHVFAREEEPVARLTPLPGGQFGLSFHSHTGRWEPMPVAGDLVHVARDLVTSLGIFLAEPDFHFGKSGSDH